MYFALLKNFASTNTYIFIEVYGAIFSISFSYNIWKICISSICVRKIYFCQMALLCLKPTILWSVFYSPMDQLSWFPDLGGSNWSESWSPGLNVASDLLWSELYLLLLLFDFPWIINLSVGFSSQSLLVDPRYIICETSSHCLLFSTSGQLLNSVTIIKTSLRF